MRAAGVGRGDLVAVSVSPAGVGGCAVANGRMAIDALDLADFARGVAAVEEELGPRWVVWSQSTAGVLASAGVRLARAWDIVAAHRLIEGGWSSDPGEIWARLEGLPVESLPVERPPDLFHQVDPDDVGTDPIGPDGYLRPDWIGGAWQRSSDRAAAWAALALDVADNQFAVLSAFPEPERALATVRSESAAEVLCAELSIDGLPIDVAAAEEVMTGYIGPRPRSATEADERRAERDREVLRHAPPGTTSDLRSPGQVKSLLRRVGIEVPDTRAWRLEAIRDQHPIVEALLVWRKAERVATTFGYQWLDDYVDADGRLRGTWSGSDGAAGRMTASAGLHNMPADMRSAVVAEDGHVFVRADLGQIEPRVLAAISGDASLARAALEADLYTPVATQLGVDRATAKVAVLGAMYGQTTGHGAEALRGLQLNYPVAIEFLESASRRAQVGTSLRTYGGRLVRMSSGNANEVSERDLRSHAAARGRYGRNAMVQGAAAELFKVWAVIVRARVAPFGARIVLCLHDELLVHVPVAHGSEVARIVDECLQEAAARWAPSPPSDGVAVRFLADTSVIERWSDAKD